MEKMLYAVFVALDGFTIGAALFGAWAAGKLLTLPNPFRGFFGKLARRRQRYMLASFLGYAVTASILLTRVVMTRSGELNADLYVYVYNIGLAVTGVGFAGLARVTIDEIVNREVDNEDDQS